MSLYIRMSQKSILRCGASFLSIFCLMVVLSESLNAQAGTEDTAPERESVQRAFNQGNYPWYDTENDQANFSPNILDGEQAGTGNRNGVSKAKVNNTPTNFNINWWLTFWIIVLIVVGAIVITLIVWLVLKMDPPSGFRDFNSEIEEELAFGSDRVESLPFELGVTNGDFRAAAENAYRSGDYRLAITYLFSHVLLTLDRHGRVRLRRGKTNRQYLVELSSNGSISLSEYFENLMVSFEASFFGHHELDRAQFEKSWQALPQFQERLSRISEGTRG